MLSASSSLETTSLIGILFEHEYTIYTITNRQTNIPQIINNLKRRAVLCAARKREPTPAAPREENDGLDQLGQMRRWSFPLASKPISTTNPSPPVSAKQWSLMIRDSCTKQIHSYVLTHKSMILTDSNNSFSKPTTSHNKWANAIRWIHALTIYNHSKNLNMIPTHLLLWSPLT